MIVASMCTIPVRKESFKQVVRRILHEQTLPISQLHVWLNGYQTLDADLPQDARIIYHLEPGNPGPRARYRVGELVSDDTVIATLDDDLDYPSDYIEVGTKALSKQAKNTSVCFAGLFWDYIVPIDSLGYYSDRRLILYPGQLDRDTLVPVLMGGAAFHWTSTFKTLMSEELPGFATNDDLMASFNLQKCKHSIICVAKSANWIRELPDQNSQHALYRSDVQTRTETFKTLVTQHGFVPWCDNKEQLRHTSAWLVVCPGEITDAVAEKLAADCPPGLVMHTLEVGDDNLAKLVARPLRSHQEHFTGVPASGGRWDHVLPVHWWREYRIRRMGTRSIRQMLSWLEHSLNIQKVTVLPTSSRSSHVLGAWAQEFERTHAVAVHFD